MAKVKAVFQNNIFQDNAFQDNTWGEYVFLFFPLIIFEIIVASLPTIAFFASISNHEFSISLFLMNLDIFVGLIRTINYKVNFIFNLHKNSYSVT